MLYTLHHIAHLIKANSTHELTKSVSLILTDSRSVAFPEETLFFALRSGRGDGHLYIDELYQKGVRSFVVDTSFQPTSAYHEAQFLTVENTLEALQRLAQAHRKSFHIPIIGITGSNGKTIVKEWLYQLLSPTLNITRSPRSYNSQVGVPLSVWLLDERTELGLFEAGISQPGEMTHLQQIIQPTIGIFTNLGEAHQEGFTSLEQKCQEKVKLFETCNVVVYNLDDPTIAAAIAQLPQPCTRLAWSKKQGNAEITITRIQKSAQQATIHYRYFGHEAHYTLPFIDEASIENSIHCMVVARHCGISAETLAQLMKQLEPIAMRLEVKEGRNGCTLINDSYNSDLKSLDIALDFMNRRFGQHCPHKTLILSDIHQTGLSQEALYQRVAQLIATRGIRKLIGIGPQITSFAPLFDLEKYFFNHCDEFVKSHTFTQIKNEKILLKGARDFRFDTLSEMLELRLHETILEVNLNAIVDNLNYYRSLMKPETKIVCMVKADAYGSGAQEVAKTLQDHKVDYLAVAVADEGAELRKAGITSHIMVMNPEVSAFNTLFEYKLEPEIYSFGLLEKLIKAAQREGITHYPVHIKLDTGMHRLGFDPEKDIPTLIERLKSQETLLPRSIFSHFVGSDSVDFNEFSARQFTLFNQASTQLEAAFSHKILRHICNSAAIEHFPERHLDMVRLGLGLYGINALNNQVLHNASTLKTTLLQIHHVAAGQTVGYSRKGLLTQDSRIAALPIGYADGLDRHLGNGRGYCIVNGKKAPYIGNICMDVSMIDVTQIDCKEGDTAIIFGQELPVTRLSELLDTIPYEILTSVGGRVKRVYYQD